MQEHSHLLQLTGLQKRTNPTFYYELVEGEIAPLGLHYQRAQQSKKHNQRARNNQTWMDWVSLLHSHHH